VRSHLKMDTTSAAVGRRKSSYPPSVRVSQYASAAAKPSPEVLARICGAARAATRSCRFTSGALRVVGRLSSAARRPTGVAGAADPSSDAQPHKTDPKAGVMERNNTNVPR